MENQCSLPSGQTLLGLTEEVGSHMHLEGMRKLWTSLDFEWGRAVCPHVWSRIEGAGPSQQPCLLLPIPLIDTFQGPIFWGSVLCGY